MVEDICFILLPFKAGHHIVILYMAISINAVKIARNFINILVTTVLKAEIYIFRNTF